MEWSREGRRNENTIHPVWGCDLENRGARNEEAAHWFVKSFLALGGFAGEWRFPVSNFADAVYGPRDDDFDDR